MVIGKRLCGVRWHNRLKIKEDQKVHDNDDDEIGYHDEDTSEWIHLDYM